MKTFTIRILTFTILGFLLIPHVAHSQKSNFLSRSYFTVNTNFLDQKSGPVDYDFQDEFQNKLFYSKPYFGIELEYQLLQQIWTGIGLNFSRSEVFRNESLMFVAAPPPGTISNFYTTYHYNNLLIEPKVALKTDFYSAEFYWSAGPIFSVALLKSSTDGATYDKPDVIVDNYQSRSNHFNLGVQGATGFNYFFTKNLGLNLEIGYKYVPKTKIEHTSSYNQWDSTINYSHQINSFYQSLGLIFRF